MTDRDLSSVSRVKELLRRAKTAPVLIVGSGITGSAACRAMSASGFKAVLIDERAVEEARAQELREIGVEIIAPFKVDQGGEGELRRYNFAFAMLSPGVPYYGPLSELIGRLLIPKLSEIDLAVAFVGSPTIAITGTNGKTTTTNLIGAMLKHDGAELVGNVGRAFIELVNPVNLRDGFIDSLKRNVVVAEVSSYQLESALDFAPHIAVWLNLSENHLERHGTMENYAAVKGKIFQGQDPDRDFAILNADDPWSQRMRRYARAMTFAFSKTRVERGAYFEGDNLVLTTGELFDCSRTKLIGEHNKMNIAAAALAARLAKAPINDIQDVIDNFNPLEHRLELVRELGGVKFINDSKSTTVAATIAALEAVGQRFPRSPVVLMVGGKAKYGSWKELAFRLSGRVERLVGFGGDGEVILQELGRECKTELPPTSYSASVAEAVSAVHAEAPRGSIVLFSPGCASFDAYNSYEERGRDFKRVVAELIEAH